LNTSTNPDSNSIFNSKSDSNFNFDTNSDFDSNSNSNYEPDFVCTLKSNLNSECVCKRMKNDEYNIFDWVQLKSENKVGVVIFHDSMCNFIIIVLNNPTTLKEIKPQNIVISEIEKKI